MYPGAKRKALGLEMHGAKEKRPKIPKKHTTPSRNEWWHLGLDWSWGRPEEAKGYTILGCIIMVCGVRSGYWL